MEELRRRLPPDFNISLKETWKSNDTPYTGVMVGREGDVGAGVVYIENMYPKYQAGASMEDLAEEAIQSVRDHPMAEAEIPNLDAEYLKENVYFRPANKELNQKRFKDVPVAQAPGADDIVLYPCVDVKVNGNHGVITVNNETLEASGLSVEELHEAAFDNTNERVELDSLGHVLQGMVPGAPMDFSSPFLVTVDKGMDGVGVGGATIFGALGRLAELKGTHYILPSSIHESLILPKKLCPDINRLFRLVPEVNVNVLKREDFLSNNIYKLEDGELETLLNPILEAELDITREA